MGKMSVRCLSLGLPLHFQLFRWTWMDPIGFHPTNGYRLSPQDNISALPNIYLTSGTLSRRDFILLPWEGVTNRILPIPSENQVFHRKTKFSIGIHWCVLDMHGGRNKGKFDNYLICFNLYSEDSYTKLRNLKHSIPDAAQISGLYTYCSKISSVRDTHSALSHISH